MKENEFLTIFSHIHKSGGTSINQHLRRNIKKEQYIHVHFNEPNCFYNLTSKSFDILRDKNQTAHYLKSLTEKKRENICAIFGHDVYFGIHEPFKKPARYYTFLRHPISRFLSYYNYSISTIKKINFDPKVGENDWLNSFFSNGKLTSFEDYIRTINSHPFILTDHFPSQIEHFSTIFDISQIHQNNQLDSAKRILQEFSFVGLTENFNDFLFTYEDMGLTKIVHNYNITEKGFVTDKDINFLLSDTPKVLTEEMELYEFAVELNSIYRKQQGDRYLQKIHTCSKRIDSWTWNMINKELDLIKGKDPIWQSSHQK